MKKNQKKTNKNMPLIAAAVICTLSIVVMLIALTVGHKQVQEDFTPPAFDDNAIAGVPTVPDNLGWTELDCKAYKVSVCGQVVANGNSADLWLYNPESNTVWLKLRILDEKGNILGETGLLKPGEYVQSVILERIPADGSAIALKIMAYQPDTYYSEGAATLNTTIRSGGAQ